MHWRGKEPRRAVGVLAAAVGLAALGPLVGCGGSSGGTTETVTTTTEAAPTDAPSSKTPTTLTMPEFIAKADAICAEENARIKPRSQAISTEGDEAESQEDLDAMADDIRSLANEIEGGLARLRMLAPPPGKADAIESMLNLAGSQAVIAGSLADAVSAEDNSQIESLGQQINLNRAKYRGLAEGLGFHKCGTG
jgi:hypothetical protein